MNDNAKKAIHAAGKVAEYATLPFAIVGNIVRRFMLFLEGHYSKAFDFHSESTLGNKIIDRTIGAIVTSITAWMVVPIVGMFTNHHKSPSANGAAEDIFSKSHPEIHSHAYPGDNQFENHAPTPATQPTRKPKASDKPGMNSTTPTDEAARRSSLMRNS